MTEDVRVMVKALEQLVNAVDPILERWERPYQAVTIMPHELALIGSAVAALKGRSIKDETK